MSDTTGRNYTSGDTSYLVEGDTRQYTCWVPDINPGASFNWTVGSRVLTSYDNHNVTDADGFTTSTSTATLSATWSNHGQMLQCQAINKDDHPGISVSVLLDIKGNKLHCLYM